MPSITGKVSFVNQPKGTSKWGSIKLGDKYISVGRGDLSRFNKGDDVAIEIKEREADDGSGRVYYDFVRFSASEQQRPQATSGNVGGKSPAQELSIFITGVVGRAMGSGKFDVHDILVLTDAAKEAYERVVIKGESPETGNASREHDDIPF